MQYIKLDAIPSTNDFLKEFVKKQAVQNYTTVIAYEQTNGKGQMGAIWKSQAGKNLTMSMYVAKDTFKLDTLFAINKVVATTVVDILVTYNLSNLSVKWPNDIMAENKKIGGILIEYVHSADFGIYAIIGIGINLNQTEFDDLPQASSVKKIFGLELDVNQVAKKISKSIKNRMQEHYTTDIQSTEIDTKYWNYLFKKNIPMAFEDAFLNRFMGIIVGISKTGLLQVQKEDDSISEYGIKEIKMLY